MLSIKKKRMLVWNTEMMNLICFLLACKKIQVNRNTPLPIHPGFLLWNFSFRKERPFAPYCTGNIY
jgi:hypothetical protein